MTERISIAVYPPPFYHKHRVLLDALQDIFFVSFHPCSRDEMGSFRFALLGGAEDDALTEVRRKEIRSLVFPTGARGAASCCQGRVEFADILEVDHTIRGQFFIEHESLEIESIPVHPGDTVLATRSGLPIWVRRNFGLASVDFLAVEPRLLNPGELLREHLHRHSVSHLIPLLHFIREAAGEVDWAPGPGGACLVIDDPSLYRPSYGYMNFREIASHAKKHGYHVAIATTALDTWWVHQQVASVFRDYPEQISLIIHGNNHTHLEMCRSLGEAEALSIAAQALRRFSRLEKQYRLSFSRVMEAPHGVIASEAFGPLVSLNYQAALYTPSQFIDWNRNECWPASFGSCPVDVFPKGLCAVPRLVMSKEWRADVMIAAFLRQSIVLAIHHQDLIQGLGFISDLAAYVNRLGNIRWSNLCDISKSRYSSRREGSFWVVRMGARLIECHVPSGVRHIIIERPWLLSEVEPLTIHGLSGTVEPLLLRAGAVSEPLPLHLAEGSRMVIKSPPDEAVHPDSVASPPKRIWHIVRKVLVEARDRFHPCNPVRMARRFSVKYQNQFKTMFHQKSKARTE